MTIARRAGAFAAALALCGVPLLWAADQASATRPSARDTRQPVARSQPSGGSSRGSSSSPSARQSRPTARDTRPTPPPSGGGGGGSHHHGGGHHFHGHHGHSFGWPYWRSWYYFDFWGPYAYGPGWWGYEGPHSADVGALDLDVAPGRTEVYVDGQYLGKVDAYDGFPQYLWLDKGTYDVVLYLDGFSTIARQITVYPGTVIQVDDRMERGDSVRPEDLATKTHERRDARLRNEREMQERARERQRDRDGDGEESDWRDRVPERSRRADAEDAEDAEEEDGALDIRDRPGRLRLEIEPEDASVYLDGRFVGTGTELSRLHAGLLVDPGSHKVSIVRPGYEPEEREFEVEAGGETELEIELERD